MKNDSFLNYAMDLAEGNDSCNGNDDGEKESVDGSSYNEVEGMKSKQSGNVNSSPSQWPLRHNNSNESLERHGSYSCNGFRQAKKPRYTYTGRISRTPSRYLDTDSDSGDGSIRKDGQNRLKVKRSRRRRKLSSSAHKLLVNGFKDHGDALLLSVADFEEEITVDKLEQECLANVEYPDVFHADTSPISNDKISHVAPKTQHGRTSRPSGLILCSENPQMYSNEGDLEPTVERVFERSTSKPTVKHSLTTTSPVDISSKNNANGSLESSKEFSEEIMRETNYEINKNGKRTLEDCSTTFLIAPCKDRNLNNTSKCNSSTSKTIVSPKEISKHCQVSCACHNGNSESFRDGEQCKNCKECTEEKTVQSSCIRSQNDGNIDNSDFKSSGKIAVGKADIGSKLSKKNRLVKTSEKLSEQLASSDSPKDSEQDAIASNVDGYEHLKDLKMRKAFAKKLKQKQLRRNDKAGLNDVLKRNDKNGVVRKAKQRSVSKVNSAKLEKQTNKSNRKKVNKAAKMKDTDVSKPEELDRVLGMRRSPSGVYEFLVQWRNGTSCWVSSDEIVMDEHNYYLREYLIESEQDVSVVNRVPFQAYCCDSLSLKECKPVPKSKKALRDILCMETLETNVCKPSVVSVKPKDDINIQYEDGYCYITLNRETCQRKNACLKLITDLITALEDVATSECDAVVIRGLRSDVLCGLNLDDMSKAGVEDKDDVILSQARYLVQTLTNYPKLLIALISKSAEGVGAMFLSLFDMICDEETWDNKQILDPSSTEEAKEKKLYTLPRLTGHSLLSEEILMGKHVEAAESCYPTSSDFEACLTDPSTVASTLMKIERTLRVLREQVNGELTELFPSNEPCFALFSDIKSDVLSHQEAGSHSNDAAVVEGCTVVADEQSLPKCAVEDHIVKETKNVHVDNEDPISDHCTVSESAISMADPVTQQNNTGNCSIDRSAMDDVAKDENAVDSMLSYQGTIQHESTDENSMEDIVTDQSTVDLLSMGESTMESLHTNAEQHIVDHTSMELNKMDQNTEQTTTAQTSMDLEDKESESTISAPGHSRAVTEESNTDHVSTDQTAMNWITTDGSTDDHEMVELTTGDQNVTTSSIAADIMGDCILANAIGENAAVHDTCANGVSDATPASTSESGVAQSVDDLAVINDVSSGNKTTNISSTIARQLNHADDIEVGNSFDQSRSNQSLCDGATSEPIVSKNIKLVQSSVKENSNDVTMECGNVSESLVDQAVTKNCLSDSNEDPTQNSIDIDGNTRTEHVKTDHTCTEKTENNTTFTGNERYTDKKCIDDGNTMDDVRSDQLTAGNTTTANINLSITNMMDETSEHDAALTADYTSDKDKSTSGFSDQGRAEGCTSVANSCDNHSTTSQSETSLNNLNRSSTKDEHSNSETIEEEKTNERVNEFTVIDFNVSNNAKQITTNDIDIDITNYPSTLDTSDHPETIQHTTTDAVHDNIADYTNVDDSTPSNENIASPSSAVAAVDRYLKKLEAQIEAEKRQAKQYIEQISRLWDNPLLWKNK